MSFEAWAAGAGAGTARRDRPQRHVDVELDRPHHLPPARLEALVEEVDRPHQHRDLVGEVEARRRAGRAEGVLAGLHVGGEGDLLQPGQVDVDVGRADAADEPGALHVAGAGGQERGGEPVVAAGRDESPERQRVLRLRVEDVVVGHAGAGADADDPDREAGEPARDLVLGEAELGVEQERVLLRQREIEPDSSCTVSNGSTPIVSPV